MFKMTELLIVFLIMFLGYLLGRISIKGLSLGTSGILIVALIFGHFQLLVPGVIKDLGLILFVTGVGLIAAPVFMENFKNKATSYILLAIFIILSGLLTIGILIKVMNVPLPLGLGILNGSLTSTPGLGAALEATGDNLASIGYGIAYPFGVIGVVLFVQLIPRFLKTDIPAEVAALENVGKKVEAKDVVVDRKKEFTIEGFGFWPVAIAIILGVLLGQITIPLPGGGEFSLGNSGGPLIMGLVIGNMKNIGPIRLKFDKRVLEAVRELGLCFFLMGTGTQAGNGLVQVLQEYGIQLFFMGVISTLVPMLIGFLLAKKVFKLSTLDSLGSITGGMTSTPALGALVNTAGSDAVGASYAATYPIALIMVVVGNQLMSLFMH